MQFTIDERRELLQSGLVAVAPSDEPRGHIVGGEHSSWNSVGERLSAALILSDPDSRHVGIYPLSAL